MRSIDQVSINDNIARVRDRIDRACEAAGRSDTATLELAVKTQDAQTCQAAARALYKAGLPVLLGHNRVQEARATAEAIRTVPGASIHLIGSLQTNKINQALACTDLIETVDSQRLVDHLDKRANGLRPVFIQVNVSGEDSKSGCRPDDVPALLDAIELSSALTLEGFMTVGLNSDHESDVRRSYCLLRDIRDAASWHLGVPEPDLQLSMGMSRDLEWAIAEGATIVRIGTDVFGPRPRRD